MCVYVCVCVNVTLSVIATPFKTVQKEVSELLEGRILVGHSVQNDLKVSCEHMRYSNVLFIAQCSSLNCHFTTGAVAITPKQKH